MNLYQIGIEVNTTRVFSNHDFVVLANSIEKAIEFVKLKFDVKHWRYTKKAKHGAYIVGATFLDTDNTDT